jgi:hypothetical protein
LDESQVDATGNIEIGEALKSKVTTLGQVIVTFSFRGGTVWALRGARFGTVGGRLEIPTRVQIGPHGTFVAGEVQPGTTVLRGTTVVKRFDAVERDVVLEPGAPGDREEGAVPTHPLRASPRAGS